VTLGEIDHVRRLREALDELADMTVSDECPDADRLWAATRGELLHEHVEETIDHLASCQACARAWRLAVDLGRLAPRVTIAAPRSAWTLARLVPAFIGANILLIAGTLIFQIVRGPSETPAASFIEPSELVSLVGPDGPVTERPDRFRWEPVASADTYQVRVYAADGTLVWTSEELMESSAAWPDSISLGEATYYWGVSAFSAGDIVAESGLASVVLAR
jgi:hypothetical protein